MSLRGWSSALVVLATALSPRALHAQRLHAQRAQLLVPVPDLEARATRDSLDPLVHYDLALGYWTQKRWAEAERAFRRAVSIEPKLAAAHLGLAYLPYAREPKLWKKLHRDDPDSASAATMAESARLYRHAFMLDPLVDLKVQGLAIPPRPAIVVGMYANFYVDAVYSALVLGFESFWDGQYRVAYQHLDGALRRFKPSEKDDVPDVLLWYHGLAAAHSFQHDIALADFQSLLDRALKREQTDTLVRGFTLESNEIRYVLGTLSRRAQRSDQAVALLQESLANDLGLYAAHAQLADIHEEGGRWYEAVLERRRALEANPEDAGLQYDLGRTLAKSRDFAEAAEVLRGAMAANPGNSRVPYTLGQVLLLLGDREGARAAFQRFVAIAPARFSAQARDAEQQLARLAQ